jgi:hypothetical protein
VHSSKNQPKGRNTAAKTSQNVGHCSKVKPQGGAPQQKTAKRQDTAAKTSQKAAHRSKANTIQKKYHI